MKVHSFFVAILFVLASTPVLPATRSVRPDGAGAAPTIQAAIDQAVDGDTVLVAPGTYTGVGNIDLNFRGKAIVVISEYGAERTIIDCEFGGAGVSFNGNEGRNSVLSGFTITRGIHPSGQGSAIVCTNSSPEIRNNIIIGNTSNSCSVYLVNSSAIFQNNTLYGNDYGILIRAGGTPRIYNNIIAASRIGPGIQCSGPGDPVVSCNNIFGNAGGDSVCGTDVGGNFSLDPQFCGIPGSANFYLQGDSPCAPSNNACGQLIGALPVLCATTPIENRSWGSIKELYR